MIATSRTEVMDELGVPQRHSTRDAEQSQIKVSVVISTFERETDLCQALDSILNQTVLPLEVIVVDDSPSTRVEEELKRISLLFAKKALPIIYHRNKGDRGLTIARNIGAEQAKGDVVLFVDDDVVLDKDYLRGLLRVYDDHPEAKGVQGLWSPKPVSRARFLMRNVFGKIFFLTQYTEGPIEVLPSLGQTYPSQLRATIPCQWLHGCNQSYTKGILSELRFDERLKGRSTGEDLDFSYRVHKRYPGTLFVTPDARLIHKNTNASLPPPQELVLMQTVYTRYLFFKLIDQNRKNKLLFSWSVLGRILARLATRSTRTREHESLSPVETLKTTMAAESLCRQHKKEIQRGEVEFFNRSLT